MKKALALPVALLLIANLAIGQQMIVVPSEATNSEGNSATWLPGCGGGGAKQILISASHLQPLIGHTITGLSFRRDGTWLEALPQSSASLVVRIGTAARSANEPAADFAVNLPQSVEVFRGALSIPPMPAIPGHVGWTAPHVVDIDFNTGFVYSGGPLALEIEATSTSTTAFYPLDGVSVSVAGSAIDVGVACGPRSVDLVRTAWISGGILGPASTTLFHLGGTVGNAGFVFFGLNPLPQPIDLTFLGAPGCQWYLNAFTLIGAPVVPSNIEAIGGLATVRLRIPADAALLGAQLCSQWLELGGAGSLVTSQMLLMSIGSSLPSLGLSQLERMSDGSVHVAPSCGPVIGFRWE